MRTQSCGSTRIIDSLLENLVWVSQPRARIEIHSLLCVWRPYTDIFWWHEFVFGSVRVRCFLRMHPPPLLRSPSFCFYPW